MRAAGLALALVTAAGCVEKSPPRAGPDPGGGSLTAAPARAPRSPLTPRELPTTSGAIAVDNLTGQLDGYRRTLARDPDTLPANVAILVDELTTRAQFLGRMADYDEAAGIAERQVAGHPKDAASYLIRAGSRAALHGFDAALGDLRTAERLGAPAAVLARARAGIAEARGDLAAALPVRHAASLAKPDLLTMGAEAALLGELGRTAEAEALFTEAQYHFDDVSPLALSWLYFQQGLMWARQGHDARARELYQAALERLPAYAPAAGHLADLLAKVHEDDRAIALLRPLAAVSDDPEYAGQLAGLLAAREPAEAARLTAAARARYAELLLQHRDAFADHAARFYLGPGRDPARALELARANLALRPTRDAQALALEAALAADQSVAACEIADHALERPGAPLGLRILAARAYTACHQPDRAQAQLAAASATK